MPELNTNICQYTKFLSNYNSKDCLLKKRRRPEPPFHGSMAHRCRGTDVKKIKLNQCVEDLLIPMTNTDRALHFMSFARS